MNRQRLRDIAENAPIALFGVVGAVMAVVLFPLSAAGAAALVAALVVSFLIIRIVRS